MGYKELIFDIDGTLWDSRALVAAGYNRLLRREGREDLLVDPETLRPLFGLTLEPLADALFPGVPAAERYALMARCMEEENRYLAEDPCQVGYPQVRQTMALLAEDHRLFLVSNSQQGYPELCMDKLGLRPYLTGHLCFGDTGTDKGTTLLTLMERYGIREGAYVGDTQGDLEAARKAKLPFVWASYGFGHPTAWDHRLDRFEELLNLGK